MIHRPLINDNLLRYLLLAILIIGLLYVGELLFVPMFYGLFIAIVLYPFCRWLEKHHFSKSLAITIGITGVFLIFGLLVWLLVLQFNALRQDLPELWAKLQPSLIRFQEWLSGSLHISQQAQSNWFQQATTKVSDNFTGILAGTFNKTIHGLFMLFIVPVFAALFLYNRKDFLLFLVKWVGPGREEKLHEILQKTMLNYYQFVRGVLFVYIIVGALNSIGLLALGIEHALLFGFMTAIMTIIPYFGIFISAMLPITVAWITTDNIWYPIGVIAIFSFVQYLEANVIFPRVVGTQLNISTWAILVAIVAGSILWGVNGMILFIPMVGMLKLLSDTIPEWEPLNILLRRSEEKKVKKQGQGRG